MRAIAYFKEKDEPYKVELIEDLPEDAEISFYQQGEFVDLCAGPHLMTTKPVKAIKNKSCRCTGEEMKKEQNAYKNLWYFLYLRKHSLMSILQCWKKLKT